ncbi:hypothetical protein EIN_070950 [Entamoeba invadens IP1]|uniref:Leucine rich repeat containing protein BspA family protein n=1 Tax=Entamoeba invadens IP1 TaxID=370355 RepID=L7FL96_ENTIV|nr:hypothetical protein EIN_070950 [Entamoeba invadens IP1]ELP83796.1 hypothetical protein EIN_070950 [Entamoeba invadens IP1]|eukprot:XP_004183142.1 hypothetical protein EIN_070950 [Entamoeba invadens IP1]
MSKLDNYNCMIVSQYFTTIKDFINLEQVCKKFNGNMAKFHYNPIPLTLKTITFFESLETLHIWQSNEENFGNDYMAQEKKRINQNTHYHIMQHPFKKLIKVCYPKMVMLTPSYWFPNASVAFYNIIVWHQVDYQVVIDNKDKNVIFKNVKLTTKSEQESCGNIPKVVTEVGMQLFKNDKMTFIEIPKYVTRLYTSAFDSCTNLTRVVFPDNLYEIGNFCFCGCINLADVVLPSRLNKIGMDAFSQCKMTSITIPQFVTLIPINCFKDCKTLKEVKLHNNIVGLNQFCFSGCVELCHIDIPSSVKSIDIGVFKNCRKLKSVTLPSEICIIQNFLFNGCDELCEIKICEKVQRLGTYCFKDCRSLKEFSIPIGVKSVANGCFEGCAMLSKVDISSTVETIGRNCFKGCVLLPSITLPLTVKSYGQSII